MLYMAMSNVPLQCVKRCALNIQICPQVNPKPVQTARHCAKPQSFAILPRAHKRTDHDFTELSIGFVPIDKLHVSLAVVAAAPEQLQHVIRVRLECAAPATARSTLI